MRMMGIDYGDARIGLALSDELGLTAQGYKVLANRSTRFEDTCRELAEIAAKESVSLFVIGLPRNMNGTYGERAERTRAFGDELARVSGIPVEWVDERLTTVSVERMLIEGNVSRQKRKKVVDKLAAVLILQTYLERRNHSQ